MPNVRDVIKNHITFAIERRPRIATVQAVHGGGYIDIYAKGMLRNVEVLGDVSVGDTVLLTWVKRPGALTEVPVAIAPGGAGPVAQVNIAVDNITIMNGKNGLAVKPGSIGLGHLNFVPALEGHEHVDTLRAGGWDVDDDGVLFNTDTRIAPDGSIILGRGDESLRLAGAHEEYRLWTGNVDPTLAPFSIKKDGSIEAIAGHIGGWLIGVDSLTSDDGNVGMSVADHEGGKWRFWAGGPPDSAPFRVNADGDVWLESAHIAADLQSQGFAPGLRGWRLDRTGTLEAQNAIIRGTIRSVVFAYQEESVFGGAWGLYKGGGKLEAPVITDPENPFDIVVKGITFAVGDILYIKDGITADNWLVVEAVQGDGETRTYTCSIVNGGSAATFEAGTTVINYGASGGFIRMYAEDGVAHLTVAKHSGQPWSPDPVLRIGDLYGYGTFGPNERGWAVGDPGGDNYAYYSDLDSKLVISGEIKAKSGSIGGWVIGDETIVGGGLTLDKDGFIKLSNGGNVAYMTANDGSWFMWAGNENPTNANFRVGVDGKLYATNADFSGVIRSATLDAELSLGDDGKITAGPLTLDRNGIYANIPQAIHVISRGYRFVELESGSYLGGLQAWRNESQNSFLLDAQGVDRNTMFVIASSAPSGKTAGIRLEVAQGFNISTAEFGITSVVLSNNLSVGGGTITIGADTNLYRAAANELKTDDNFSVGGGTINIGPDCTLRRSTANMLVTDDNFVVYGSLQVGTGAVLTNSIGTTLKTGGNLHVGGTTIQIGDDTGFYRSGADLIRTNDTLSVMTLRISDSYTVDLTADAANRLRVQNLYVSNTLRMTNLQRYRNDAWVSGFIFVPYYTRAVNGATYAAGTNNALEPTSFGLASTARPKAYCIKYMCSWADDASSGDKFNIIGYVNDTTQYIAAVYNTTKNVMQSGWAIVPAHSNGQIRYSVEGGTAYNIYIDCVGYFI